MSVETVGNVYLLHFETKVHGRQHYVGFTRQTIAERVASHRDGSGSQLSRLAVKQGVAILLSKRWENVPVSFEKQLKREKNLKRHCHHCAEASGPVPPQAR